MGNYCCACGGPAHRKPPVVSYDKSVRFSGRFRKAISFAASSVLVSAVLSVRMTIVAALHKFQQICFAVSNFWQDRCLLGAPRCGVRWFEDQASL